jgi:MFS family permease
MALFEPIYSASQKLRAIVPLDKRNKHLSFLIVLIATCLDNFSLATGITSLLSTQKHFNTTSVIASWTLSSYTLTLGAFIMLAGKLTDVLGPDLVFLVGIFGAGIASLINAVIEDQVIVLIVFRAIQGIFAASLIPSSFAIAGVYYEGKQLGIAVNALVVALTAVFGIATVLGGAFSLTNVGYKGAYYSVFALAMVLFLILYFSMYPVPRTKEHDDLSLKYLDYPAAVTLVVGILLIILGITEGGDSWNRASAYVPLVIGVIVTITGIWFEVIYLSNYKMNIESSLQRSSAVSAQGNPISNGNEKVDFDNTAHENSTSWRYKVQLLLPKEAFEIPSLYAYLIATFLLFITFIVGVVSMVQYYQFVNRDSALLAGLKNLPISVGLCFGAMVNQEGPVYKVGMKYCLLLSTLILVGSTVWMSRHDFRIENSYWKYDAVSQLLFGYGFNLYFNIYINAILRRAPVHLHGVVSGLLQTVSQVAMSLGNSLLSSFLGDLEITDSVDYRVELQSKFRNALYLAISCAAVSFVALLFVKNQTSVESPPLKEEAVSNEIEDDPKV